MPLATEASQRDGAEPRAHSPYRSPPAEEAVPVQGAAIECEGLVHSFGPKQVLRGVTFRVPKGAIYGFIGENGAGKTTTLRILATLLVPVEGTARVGGRDVVTHPEDVRAILGFMPDTPGTFERVHVDEYLHFFASAHGIRREHRARAVARVVELTEIGRFASADASSLSKGQKQRLLLARTLLHDPEVLILDEPASDLDPRARVELRTLLGTLARMGKTILLSSHILTELAELCDSIGVLEGGTIVASGPIRDVQAAIRPGRRVRFTVLSRATEAASVLRDCRGVVAVAATGESDGAHVVEATYEGDEWIIADTVAALAAAKIAVCAVEPERTDLERLFMEATHKRPGDSR
jgi:ABC-2 type transport system ATP-binding protein